MNDSGWVQSPHIEILRDPKKHDSLEPYFKGVLGRFKDDPRVIVWDLYNEPGNDGERDKMTTEQKEEKCLLLLKKMFTWAREVNPSQPLTAGVWSQEWVGPNITAQNLFMRENSDVISFHSYDNLPRTAERVGSLKPFSRPILCTEYIARGNGSRFEHCRPGEVDTVVHRVKTAGIDTDRGCETAMRCGQGANAYQAGKGYDFSTMAVNAFVWQQGGDIWDESKAPEAQAEGVVNSDVAVAAFDEDRAVAVHDRGFGADRVRRRRAGLGDPGFEMVVSARRHSGDGPAKGQQDQ